MTSADEPGPGEQTPPGEQTRPGVTTVAIGTAMMAADQVRDGVRAVGERSLSTATGWLRAARTRSEAAQSRLRAAVDQAERRGRETLGSRRNDASAMVDTRVDGAVSGVLGWAQVNVMPKLVDDLVPHLISDVMPRLIEGAIPEIKNRVIPVLIDDLTNDPRVRELILAQSRGVLGQVTEQIRTGTTQADDRFEIAAHRVFRRSDKGTNSARATHETRGA